MKFIKGYFKGMNVIVEDNTEIEMDVDEVIEKIRAGSEISDCYLFLPSDKPNCGAPIEPTVSREKYLENPAVYGVAIYKSWRGNVTFE